MKEEMLQILENSSMGEKETKAVHTQLLNLFSVSGSVFVLQHKETRRIHGCFDTREKAEKYANDSTNIAIMELEIA